MAINLKYNKYYSILGRLVSATIAFLSFFLALPKTIGTSYLGSFFLALTAGVLSFLLDTLILTRRTSKEHDHTFIYSIRIISSILTAWIGGFAVTLQTFWSVYLGYSKIYSGNYIQVFMRMLENNRDVLLSLIVITIALFIGDNLGRIFNHLAIQESVIAQKEDTIQSQVTEIKHKDEQLEHSYQQQIDIISSIQHELGNKLPIAKNVLSDLKTALNNLSLFDLNQKIRQRLPGEPESAVDTFSDLLNRLESNLFYGISIVDNIQGLLKADHTRFEPLKLDLKKYLNDEIPKHTNLIPDLKWDVTGSDVILLIDPIQFSILLHNVIENAQRHGFTTLKGTQPIIDFFISESGDSVSLLIRNNGTSLPIGFTNDIFTKAGAVLGLSGNSGLGGYLIGLVAANHKAQLMVRESKAPYTVEMLLTFPK